VKSVKSCEEWESGDVCDGSDGSGCIGDVWMGVDASVDGSGCIVAPECWSIIRQSRRRRSSAKVKEKEEEEEEEERPPCVMVMLHDAT